MSKKSTRVVRAEKESIQIVRRVAGRERGVEALVRPRRQKHMVDVVVAGLARQRRHRMHYLQHVQIGERLRRQRKHNRRTCSHGVPVVVVISGVLIGDVK